MDEELYIFIRADKIRRSVHDKYSIYTKDRAEKIMNGNTSYPEKHTLCRLVPCSVSEQSEVVTQVKKVIV